MDELDTTIFKIHYTTYSDVGDSVCTLHVFIYVRIQTSSWANFQGGLKYTFINHLRIETKSHAYLCSCLRAKQSRYIMNL